MAKLDYIKLFRSLEDWEWYKDSPTKDIFIHLLIRANWKDTKYKGEEIKRGSLVTSISNLAEETGLTIQQTRTALLHLEKSGEITRKATNKYTIINVVNYSVFQSFEESEQHAKQQTTNKQTTSKRHAEQQATNKQLTNKQQTEENQERKEAKERNYYNNIIYNNTEEEKKERNTKVVNIPPFFDSVWKDIVIPYPRRKGMELDCKQEYYKIFAEQENQEQFFADTKEAVYNYVKRYDTEHPDDTSRKYILSFKRFFEEELAEELKKIRQERQPKGWHENGQRLTSEEMEAVIDTPYSHEKQLEYSEVLREICRIYQVANRTYKAYSNLFFAIVNQYEDATGANLIYTAVSEYLDDMQRKGCYAIPELAYWLKNNAVGIMGSLTEYKKII